MKALRQELQFGFNSAPDPEWLDGLLSPWRTEVGKLSLIRAAVALNTNHTTELTPLLPALTLPTLIIWGEDDSFQLVKYGQRLADDIPGAHLVRIAGASHFVMLDQPARVHSTLQDFLRREVAPLQRAAA
jgi:pimeloyl-ACP methyl ester carboxylesterase